MGALGLQDVSGPATMDSVVSLSVLAELTGFPVSYIEKELFLEDGSPAEITLEELRLKVLAYLDSNF